MKFFRTKQEKLNRALCKACYEGNDKAFENAKHLLKEGASPTTPAVVSGFSSHPYPPIRFALTSGLRFVELLFSTNTINVNDFVGDYTPLIQSCISSDIKTARFLIEKGADLDASGSDGWTALHCAASRGRLDIVNLLLDKGANPKKRNESGNTPANAARGNNHQGIADLLAAKEEPPVAALQPGWEMTDDSEICFVEVKEKIGYRFTSIFNFNAGLYTRISCNMKTGHESQAIRFFDELPNLRVLEDAYNELCKRGGNPVSPFTNKIIPRKPGA